MEWMLLLLHPMFSGSDEMELMKLNEKIERYGKMDKQRERKR